MKSKSAQRKIRWGEIRTIHKQVSKNRGQKTQQQAYITTSS